MNWRCASIRPRFFRPVLFCHALLLCCAASCVKLPRRAGVVGAKETTSRPALTRPRVNINHATREELERLPGIGPGLAERIIEHRARHGAFRRVEHLLAVRGISESRFEELREGVTVE